MSKIVYCIPSLHNAGGMERVLTIKANYLSNVFGHDIYIINYQNPDNKAPFFQLEHNIKIINITNKKNKFIELYKVVNKITPDYFVSLGGTEMMFIYLLSPNIKSILEWHFCYNQPILEKKYTLNPLSKLIAYIKREKNVYFAKKFNQLIVLTQADHNLWSKRGITSIRTINNPIERNEGIKLIAKAKRKKIKFISAGRLTTQKSFDRMIDVFNNAKLSFDWELNIYGSGEKYNELQKKIKNYSLERNIKIHKPIKNLYSQLIESDFFIMTSIYEGLPMVLLESISVGLPIIAFDCPTGPSDIIINKYNGYLIRNNNNNNFSEVLSKLSINDNYNEMSMHALEVAKKFNINSICKQWNSIFTMHNL